MKEGFKTFIQAKVSVLVATPTLLDARLELGSVSQQVIVESAAAPTINTQDATVGNTFNEQEVKDLPILARNVVNLLTLQPGVVFTGMSDTDKLNMGSIATMDTREGVVDGIRGNQTDVTLDGVDSNDWQNQSAFTSALPVTLDSVQEFRVTTTNANATNGLTGGAQVQMVTKSGSDQFHGAAYWYYRTTGASANSWFNNDNGVGPAETPAKPRWRRVRRSYQERSRLLLPQQRGAARCHRRPFELPHCPVRFSARRRPDLPVRSDFRCRLPRRDRARD